MMIKQYALKMPSYGIEQSHLVISMMTNEPLLFYREFGNNYYKKYFQANGSAMHILNKYPEDKFWKNFFC